MHTSPNRVASPTRSQQPAELSGLCAARPVALEAGLQQAASAMEEAMKPTEGHERCRVVCGGKGNRRARSAKERQAHGSPAAEEVCCDSQAGGADCLRQ